ncbi:CLUMA_CG015566, isoform A [Clunio marinus]|uniref:CLUMA_CG015566, isoform A n=1 Tax=Clunio marinus TaxID=568069 RepID=A0A1J1IPD9_9DIPT|nr:CLUMA_CG015566, isoform A [Clunio marinus]
MELLIEVMLKRMLLDMSDLRNSRMTSIKISMSFVNLFSIDPQHELARSKSLSLFSTAVVMISA